MNVFLSYRRDDSRDVTERICDRLVAQFGRASVFKDVNSIVPGADFRKQLNEALNRSHVLIAVVGKKWPKSRDKSGKTRLRDVDDFVRIEIETALERGIPVVPLLIDPAQMPTAKEVPQSLLPFVFRQAILIRPDPHFHDDIDRLLGVLKKYDPSRSDESSLLSTEILEHEAQEAVETPLKSQAILDRRLATEIVVLFSREPSGVVLDPRLPRLLEFGLGLYEQLLVENQYGSTLFHVMRKEPNIFRDSLCVLRHKSQFVNDRDFSEMASDAADLWANDAQFQLVVAQYDRKKGGAIAAVEENIDYLQSLLQLARRFDAAIVPHPDRWPLLKWFFDHSLWATEKRLIRKITVTLPAKVTDFPQHLSPTLLQRSSQFGARFPASDDRPLQLVRYGPSPYPFPSGMSRHYELDDLMTAPFHYEFLII